MSRAVEVLEENKDLGIGLVLDQDRCLIGTVTDGDVRRALIMHRSMDTTVTELMNADPLVATTGDNPALIQRKMSENNVARIPVVDRSYRIIRVERDITLNPGMRLENPVLLMAGGYGRRLHPLTVDKPKPMLPIGDKPLLEEMLRQLIDQGFHNIFISVHYRADVIRNYFGDGAKWGVTIEYLEEAEPLGTAGSVGLLSAKEFVGPVIVINGDLLTRVDYRRLLSYHREQSGVATMCVREYDLEVPYGVIEADGERVTSVVEKPVHRFFVNAGIYVLDQFIFDEIEIGSRLDMTDLLQGHVSRGAHVCMFPIHEYWLDIGRIPEYERAQKDATERLSKN
jgi:dTDP-glucose pyrophosphorylase